MSRQALRDRLIPLGTATVLLPSLRGLQVLRRARWGFVEGRACCRRFVLSAYGVGTDLTGGGGPGSVGQSALSAVYFPGRGDGFIPLMTERARERGRWPPPPARTAQGAWLSCLRLRRAGGWEEKSRRSDCDGDLQLPGFDRSGGPSGVMEQWGAKLFSSPSPSAPRTKIKTQSALRRPAGVGASSGTGRPRGECGQAPPEPKANIPAGRCPYRKPTIFTAHSTRPLTPHPQAAESRNLLRPAEEKSPAMAGLSGTAERATLTSPCPGSPPLRPHEPRLPDRRDNGTTAPPAARPVRTATGCRWEC